MNHLSSTIAVALALFAAAPMPAAAQDAQGYYRDDYGYGGARVRCESVGGRYQECPMDTRGGVRISNQLSNTQCLQGRNWGYGRAGVWVSDGCRAEFSATGYGSGYGNGDYGDRGYGSGGTVRCESDGGRYRTCPLPYGGRGRAILVNQLSNTRCIEGRNWGSDGRGIWVSDGCRAEFALQGRGYGDGRDRYRDRDERPWRDPRRPDANSDGPWVGGGPGYPVRCESRDGRNEFCDASALPNGIRGARMVRQLSSSPCILGQTWGWEPRGLWVSQGCRADFEVR